MSTYVNKKKSRKWSLAASRRSIEGPRSNSGRATLYLPLLGRINKTLSSSAVDRAQLIASCLCMCIPKLDYKYVQTILYGREAGKNMIAKPASQD
jgi:hypothetical protein